MYLYFEKHIPELNVILLYDRIYQAHEISIKIVMYDKKTSELKIHEIGMTGRHLSKKYGTLNTRKTNDRVSAMSGNLLPHKHTGEIWSFLQCQENLNLSHCHPRMSQHA